MRVYICAPSAARAFVNQKGIDQTSGETHLLRVRSLLKNRNTSLIALCLLGGMLWWLQAWGQPLTDTVPSEPETQDVSKTTLNYFDAFILGLVEGITEYLPISSTGHLLLANRLLGLDAEAPLFAPDGSPLMREDDTGDLVPYTLKNAADAYAIIIQAGAIAAVVLLYWKRLLGVALGFVGLDTNGRRLGINLIVAFLPAAVLGLLLDEIIERLLFHTGPVLAALFVGAFLMIGVEMWRKKQSRDTTPNAGPDLHELPLRSCLLIGFLQCVAMWPGTSRSMMTIVGGYLVGLNPKRAAEFSFLLGLITLTAASGYKFFKPIVFGGPTLFEALDWGPVLLGILISWISAALAVKWLVSWLTRHGLMIFAYYRIVLALVLGWVLLT